MSDPHGRFWRSGPRSRDLLRYFRSLDSAFPALSRFGACASLGGNSRLCSSQIAPFLCGPQAKRFRTRWCHERHRPASLNGTFRRTGLRTNYGSGRFCESKADPAIAESFRSLRPHLFRPSSRAASRSGARAARAPRSLGRTIRRRTIQRSAQGSPSRPDQRRKFLLSKADAVEDRDGHRADR